MVGIGRDLGRSSGPMPLPEQEQLDQVTQDRVQAGFECLWRRKLHKPPLGSLFSCSVTLTIKKFSLTFKWNLLCSSLHPLPLVLSLDVTEKSLAPSS